MPMEDFGIFEPGTDRELGYEEHGEICISGPTVMKEYLNNPVETSKIIMLHKDGKRWIHTKDIGYIDVDGNVYHIERIKNIFMRTGFNVHPSKIAEFINTLPLVNNCCVIGFEHPEEQCVPVAFIVTRNSQQSITEIETEIRSACYKNLEESSVPYGFVFVDELPINVGGKIDELILRKKSEINFMQNREIPYKRINFLEIK